MWPSVRIKVMFREVKGKKMPVYFLIVDRVFYTPHRFFFWVHRGMCGREVLFALFLRLF